MTDEHQPTRRKPTQRILRSVVYQALGLSLTTTSGGALIASGAVTTVLDGCNRTTTQPTMSPNPGEQNLPTVPPGAVSVGGPDVPFVAVPPPGIVAPPPPGIVTIGSTIAPMPTPPGTVVAPSPPIGHVRVGSVRVGRVMPPGRHWPHGNNVPMIEKPSQEPRPTRGVRRAMDHSLSPFVTGVITRSSE